MHWIERDGVRVPRRIAGHPALDLCNTRAGWGELTPAAGEWLTGYDVLVAWTGYADLLDADEERRLRRRTGAGADRVLSDVRRLRSQLRRAVLDPQDDRALAGVSGHVRRATEQLRLEPAADGGAPTWRVGAERRVELPLHRIAWSAGDLLTSGRLGEVGRCAGPACGWLYLNPTGRRRWCSMSSCGNRAKVAAYAERQRRG